jgi:FGGY-family pentulose kinase
MADQFVVGVDVGTGSVRAGIFTLDGTMLAASSLPIVEYHPSVDVYEQSSENIWAQTGRVVRRALNEAGVSAQSVVGISFDATCSLVVLDQKGNPLTVSESGDSARNIIVWRDHRAIDQVNRINAGGYDVLGYVGGIMSPEQEPPKLLWLKEHLPDTWRRAGKFFDLADYMVYRASGSDLRSLCTQVCKWTYLGHESRWDTSFFDGIGLSDLFEREKVISRVAPMGEKAGSLSPEAAEHLGLTAKTAVGVGIIDAHAGGIGVGVREPVLALIGGTSSCHMAVSKEPRFIPGVWGPYYGAMLPGMWLSEGGQSATGALLDHAIERFGLVKEEDHYWHVLTGKDLNTVHAELNAYIAAKGVDSDWTKRLHILPDHHGNRSPKADPDARGCIDGLTLDMSYDTLAQIYHATIQAVAYGTRHIIDEMENQGYRIERIHACGGGTRNPLWIQEHADATQRPIHLPREPEAVLLGAAILGAFGSIEEAMGRMCHAGQVIDPDPKMAGFHDWKYAHQLQMYEQQVARRGR